MDVIELWWLSRVAWRQTSNACRDSPRCPSAHDRWSQRTPRSAPPPARSSDSATSRVGTVVEMTLLLTICSVLAVWALLTVLVVGLLLVLKTLESIRGSMEKIAMGVRAIEQETLPLGAHADTLAATLAQAPPAEVVAARVRDVVTALETH